MNKDFLEALLTKVAHNQLSISAALDQLKDLPFEDLGFAKVDHHRTIRNGFPEVIFCQGKTPEQVSNIFAKLAEKNQCVLATRADLTTFAAVKNNFPLAHYNTLARTITFGSPLTPAKKGLVLILSAGTADLPVAEEAYETSLFLGNPTQKIYDVGVAGIHRLLTYKDALNQAAVIIVVAGMEGALASVVGGLTDKPVIAVPTSVGYGANFGGIAALLSMLNSCASGVAVVNIDNGFGAATMANAINSLGGCHID